MKSKLNRVGAQHKVTFKPRKVCLKAEEATAFNKRFKGRMKDTIIFLKIKKSQCQFGAFILFYTLKEAERTAMLNGGGLKTVECVDDWTIFSLSLKRHSITVEQAKAAGHFISVVRICRESIATCVELWADTFAPSILGSSALSRNANHFIPGGCHNINQWNTHRCELKLWCDEVNQSGRWCLPINVGILLLQSAGSFEQTKGCHRNVLAGFENN